MKKRIPLKQLKPGMYLVGVDKSWLDTPFFINKRRIKGGEEIALLKQYGINEVVIDTKRGDDVKIAPPATIPEPPPDIPQDTSPTLPDEPHDIPSLANELPELPKAKEVRTEAVKKVEAIFESTKSGAPVDTQAAKSVVTDLLDSILRCSDASLILLQAQQFDDHLFTHEVDVCTTSLVVAKEQELDESQFIPLGMGALLHDVGKMYLPRNLYLKRDFYTDHEEKLMQAHSRLGAAVLAKTGNIPEEVQRIVAEHHELINGTGYPAGLKEGQISLLSQIVAINDAYHNILRGHVGQPRPSPTQALRELYRRGVEGHFDQMWVEGTIRSLGIYPVGTLVELNTGEVGVVISTNREEQLKPTVRLILKSEQEPYDPPFVVNLFTPPSGAPERVIEQAADPAKWNINVTQYLDLEDLKIAPAINE